jgi:5'-nucleotidase
MINSQILITNDDGIESPGLQAAVEAVINLGEVTVIAPTTQQTGTGRGLTGNKQSILSPVEYNVNGKNIKAFHCDCSPALIVRHSLMTVFRVKKPDLVISGINYGENLGTSVTCSGTVGAALEAASEGIPSIAISKQTDIASHHKYTNQDWSTTAYFLKYFSELLLNNKMMYDVDVLKIDVPASATSDTAWKFTKLARSGYYFKEIETPNLECKLNAGNTVIKIDKSKLNPDTDIHTFAIQNLISVTPLSIDISSRVNFDDLQNHINNSNQTFNADSGNNPAAG